MTRLIITFVVWSVANLVSLAAWAPHFYNPRCQTNLGVISQDVDEPSTDEPEVPYVIARGDGSTGGGGLPMPQKNASEANKELRRPKVNAEMPQG